MENSNQMRLLSQNIDSFIIDSGNLLTNEDIKRKVSILPTEEFVEGMNQMINKWQQNGSPRTEGKTAFITDRVNTSATIPSAERQTFRITVKLFLFDDCKDNCPALKAVVNVVVKELSIESIDSLILSLSNRSTKLSLEDIKPFWLSAETVVADGMASQLGISDLDTNQLKQLHEWSQTSKPLTNHINLEACCVIPEDMSAFAKQNNIQLLTHNDPKDFLPEERFQQMISGLVADSKLWKRCWLAKYSVIIASKGILQNKGYIFCAKKLNQN